MMGQRLTLDDIWSIRCRKEASSSESISASGKASEMHFSVCNAYLCPVWKRCSWHQLAPSPSYVAIHILHFVEVARRNVV